MALDPTTKAILGTAIGVQSAGLLAKNLSLLKKRKGKIKPAKKLSKLAIKNIVGINLLKAQSEMIS